jgi:hypothetical protein
VLASFNNSAGQDARADVGSSQQNNMQNPSLVPIKSTWPVAKGKVLTDRRIVNYIKKGFYGRIEQLRQLARSANKSVRETAKKELVRFEGQPVKKPTTRNRTVDISEFV